MFFSLLKYYAPMAILVFAIPSSFGFADALGSLETYGQWNDVTNQSSIGTWTKVDSPNPVVTQGELVTAPAHGSVIPRTGNMILDLRTESQYASGGDGANYNYEINSDDLGGTNPASVSSGVMSLDFWICPDTWSGDAGFFTPAGIYQTTSLLNSSGDVLASVGMNSLGNQNAPEVHVSVDGINWINTGLQATNATWTEVTMEVNLNTMTSTIGFTDINSNSFQSGNLAWGSSVTDTSVTTLNFQMDDGLGKNYFDDFSFTAVTAVPEPSASELVAIGMVFLAIKRRKRIQRI